MVYFSSAIHPTPKESGLSAQILCNNGQFVMKYSALNCTKTHEIKLEKGSTISVIIESKSGRVDILVEEVNGEELYKGDNAASNKFTLNVDKTGTYKFTVTGNNAKGSVSFKISD